MYKELKVQGALVNDLITTSDPIIPNVFHYVRYVVSQVISSPPAEERGKFFLIYVVLFPIVCELIQYGLQFKKKEYESQRGFWSGLPISPNILKSAAGHSRC